ncbi:MAG: bifunctional phosphoribosylaminoimidazolecarboxamide formyltransferase/inosine monophosphate cyclohydrolase [Rhodospirillaceae bacterium]|nr:bifunctional phosphoribosylaminoimidazolecarboxamide formyltransferase/inosine monophosphate cyclohydrolase [Rhodospirillaceae bacterium]|tara:strand:+ start:240 stop:1808 length:1569 start_codon:yes stop_codon:yes gene_type:complete
MRIKRALISVSDKTKLETLGFFLQENNISILSTGGSASKLKAAGIEVQEVSDFTNYPEILDGRVKTLHPKIHGGILGKRDLPSHTEKMKELDIQPIDLLVINLYPFEETVESGADFETCIENIDIGGPAMARAGAKNHNTVTVLMDPDDYEIVMAEILENNGNSTPETRRKLAAAAYAKTAAYDAAIANWFAQQSEDLYPKHYFIGGKLTQKMRYGENPHQTAAFYRDNSRIIGVGSAKQIQGKKLSYNNINDTNAAFELLGEFSEPAVCIIKHANPCGVAEASSLTKAYDLALRCDPVSAFGGIIALNRAIDSRTAKKISELFVEVIIAPHLDEGATEILSEKKNLRVLVTGEMPDATYEGYSMKSVSGGFLLQSRDNAQTLEPDLKVVTKRAPTEQELADLLFAFSVCKHVKSNAIVYAKDKATVGIGAGQMSRIDSCRIASQKSMDAANTLGEKQPLTNGSVVASDAFFPFPDGLLAAARSGATAVIQPGGSIRDNEVISAADNHNLAMVFTGVRHFRH